ncbi:MAG: phosphotransferase [Chloroflexota bacterium]
MTALDSQSLPVNIATYLHNAKYEYVNDGFSPAQIYRVHTAEQVAYLKIASHTNHDSLRDEQVALHWLRGKITVPRPLAYATDDTYEYLLTTPINGIHPMDDNFSIAPEKRVSLLASIARKMHAIPHENDLPRRTHTDHLVRVKTIHADSQDDVVNKHLSIMTDLLPTLSDSTLVVTHGDFYPVNMRVHPETSAFIGVLDVGRLALADPYLDLAPLADAIGWHMDTKWLPTLFTACDSPYENDKLRFYQSYHKLMAHYTSSGKKAI